MGRVKRRPPALALLAALALLVMAAPAGAEHRKFRVGVTDDAIEPAGNVAGMGATNASVFRLVFNWSRTEVSAGRVGRCDNTFDWSYYDSVIAEAGRHGVRLLPIILGSPDYVGDKPQTAPRTGSPAIADYKCFVRAAVERYGRGGDLVRLLRARDAPVVPITTWQAWNEPNMALFATERGVNAREYGRLVKVTHRQLSQGDRRAKVILAGMPERLRSARNGAKQFLRRMYRVKRVERSFDAVALHPYAENRSGVKGALIRMRRLLRRVGDPRRPLWLTEVGWSTHGPKGNFLVKSEAGQARQLRKTFAMLRKSRKRFKLGTVNWFRWRDLDTPAGPSKRVFDFAGLYREDGSPKPSCRKFARVTSGSCPTLDGGSGTAGAASLADPARAAAATRPSPAE